MSNEYQLANCSYCGELFVKSNNRYCQRCESTHKKNYKQLIEKIRTTPDIRVKDLEEVTNIPQEAIIQSLKHTDLISESSHNKSKCRLCKAELRNTFRKKICDKCYNKLASNSNKIQRIDSLRMNLKKRIIEKERAPKRELMAKSSGFRNKFKKIDVSLVGFEAELLPDIIKSSKLKLSNSSNLSHLVVYN